MRNDALERAMKAIKKPKGVRLWTTPDRTAQREYDNIDRFVLVFHDEIVNLMSKDPDIPSTWVPDKADPRAFFGKNWRAFDFWSDEDEWAAVEGEDNFSY